MRKDTEKLRQEIRKILDSALEAADPEKAVKRALSCKNQTLTIGEHAFPLEDFRKIVVVGAGKATARMAVATLEILGDRDPQGVVSVRELPDIESFPIEIIKAGHPVPNEESQKAARAALDLVRPLNEDHLVICLISGGASALWSAPAEGLTLEDKARTTDTLLACGADIHEINSVRKHLSAIKGGRLARAVQPARLLTLAISDVVGDAHDSIGSGPTVGDSTSFSDALNVVSKYELEDQIPASVIEHLNRGVDGNIPETPGPDEDFFSRALYEIIASNRGALEAASQRAKELGYEVILQDEPQTGEARDVGKELAEQAKKLQRELASSEKQPTVIISGGETTVTIKGDGKGGRNQELTLAGALELKGTKGIILASFGTDGSDGPTDAAGAFADGSTVERGADQGLDARKHLDNNDSYNFFEPLGDLIQTGPTGTNVMDIQVVVVETEPD